MERREFLEHVADGKYVKAIPLVRVLCGYGEKVAATTLRTKLKLPLLRGCKEVLADDNRTKLLSKGQASTEDHLITWRRGWGVRGEFHGPSS